jgi:23S rRNA A2030 N6-methylase RlmJ
MKQGTRATALSHLYLKNIRTLKLILPPLEVQNEFARIVEQSDKSKYVAFQETKFIKNLLKYTYNHYFRRKNYVH